MPILTDSDAWQNGESGDRTRDEILDYLSENDGQAFTSFELTDELFDTHWADWFIKQEVLEEVGEEEFRENEEKYEDEYDIDIPLSASWDDQQHRLHVISNLDSLIRDGLVEHREIPIEDTEIPVEDWEEVTFYTYAGD